MKTIGLDGVVETTGDVVGLVVSLLIIEVERLLDITPPTTKQTSDISRLK
jgi:hypothetical protein